ncbi:hypothetical protein E6H36_05030 [Candidatus Bathyarchaeota archaeon]|nr:MAG: hypothetical protein E6H36_05030 [Candidatus Bathyarchaeota archaeon]TMI30514.1 MAG: hypothetical protein E6H29_08205 [Candidatus Bathyarchaeota archaeon]
MADGPSKLQSEIEMAKQVLAAVAGVRLEEIIIKEAQAHPHRSFATPADRDEHQANVLMIAIREAVKHDIVRSMKRWLAIHQAPMLFVWGRRVEEGSQGLRIPAIAN